MVPRVIWMLIKAFRVTLKVVHEPFPLKTKIHTYWLNLIWKHQRFLGHIVDWEEKQNCHVNFSFSKWHIVVHWHRVQNQNWSCTSFSRMSFDHAGLMSLFDVKRPVRCLQNTKLHVIRWKRLTFFGFEIWNGVSYWTF